MTNVVKLIGEIELALKGGAVSKVVSQVEKGLKNTKVAVKSAGGKASEGIGKLVSGAMNMGKKGMSSIGKSIGKVLKGFAILVGIAGAVSGILRVFETVSKVVDVVFKVIGEFLRPVTRAIMIVMMPVIQMLRPVLMMFKALMKPFEKAANVGIRAGMRLSGMGQRELLKEGGDKELGWDLIGEGSKTMLDSASLLMSGFTQTLLGPLAELFGFGDAFDGVMKSWQSAALDGIVTGDYLVKTIEALGGQSMLDAEMFSEAMGLVDQGITDLHEIVGDFTMENIDSVLEATGLMAKNTAALYAGDLTLMEATAEAMADVLGITIDKAKIPVAGIAEQFLKMADNGKKAIAAMQAMSVEKKKELSGDMAQSSMNDMKSIKHSKWDQFKAGAKGLFKGFHAEPGKDIRKGGANAVVAFKVIKGMEESRKAQEKYANSVHEKQIQVAKDYAETQTTLWGGQKEAQAAGLNEMLEEIMKYMGNSLIPDAWVAGLVEIHEATLTGFTIIGSEIMTLFGASGIVTSGVTTGTSNMTIAMTSFNTAAKNNVKMTNNAIRQSASLARQVDTLQRRIEKYRKRDSKDAS